MRTKRFARVATLSLTWLIALGSACGDDSGTGGGGGAGGGDGGGGSAAGVELDVRVVDPQTGQALAAMPVAIDLTGGARVELETDATGHARTTLDLDLVEGVITHKDHRSFSAASPARISRGEAGNGFVELYSFSTVGMFEGESETAVTGAITNASATDTHIFVTQTGRGAVLDEVGATSYATAVPTGEPFSLVALEWEEVAKTQTTYEELHHGWVVASHAGVTAPTTLDLDFGASVAPTVVSGQVVAPPSAYLAEQSFLWLFVLSGGGFDTAVVGTTTLTALNAEHTAYDFTLDYVDVPGDSPETLYQLNTADGGYSFVFQKGLPTEGTTDVGFLVPPQRTAPVGAGPHPWSTPMEWTVAAADAEKVHVYYYTEGRAIGWGLVAPSDTRFTMPALPSSSTVLPTTPLYAGVEVVESTDTDGMYEKEARAAKFEVTSPFTE